MKAIHPSPVGLTCGAILFAREWIAEARPAMTSDEYQRNAL